MSHDEMESLVAGYVLLALDPEDREAFLAHLATCDLCVRSVAEWQQLAGSLPLLVEQREPPQGLEGRILSAVRAQGAVRPLPTSGAPGWRRAITRPVAVGATVAVLALAEPGWQSSHFFPKTNPASARLSWKRPIWVSTSWARRSVGGTSPVRVKSRAPPALWPILSGTLWPAW